MSLQNEFLWAYALGSVFFIVFSFLIWRWRRRKSLPPSTKSPLQSGESPLVHPVASLEDNKKASGSSGFTKGLFTTKGRLWERLGPIFLSSQHKIDRQSALLQLEESLIMADVGVGASQYLLEELKKSLPREWDGQQLRETLKQQMEQLLSSVPLPLHTLENPVTHVPHVVMLVGVNGAGKTTTAAKLAKRCKDKGFSVVLGAGDTFRAAAVEQLNQWAQRLDVPCISMDTGADAASVAYQSVHRALAQPLPCVCLLDTAGRLHNRKDLMDELHKVKRVLSKQCEGAPHGVLLVCDATIGQNALQQARLFHQWMDVSGIVLTKLDGTAKGGIVLAIAHELKIPVLYAGVGEGAGDLLPFDARAFVENLV